MWRAATRALIFLLLLPFATTVFSYLLGTETRWTVENVLWMAAASLLYALLMHYFESGWFSDSENASVSPSSTP